MTNRYRRHCSLPTDSSKALTPVVGEDRSATPGAKKRERSHVEGQRWEMERGDVRESGRRDEGIEVLEEVHVSDTLERMGRPRESRT